MAKQGRHRRRGGRTTPKGTRPIGYRNSVGHDEPELVRNARAAIRGGPIELLALASSLVETCTERPADRFGGRSTPVPDLATCLVDFARSDFGPARTLAAAMLPMVSDEQLVARVRQLLDRSRPAEPDWMSTLDQPRLERVVTTREPFGDGDNIVISVRWPSGHAASACLYIDHNLGSIAKDGFVLPLGADEYERTFRHLAEAGLWIDEIDPATARARISDAIRFGELTVPPWVGDEWPQCRPLVEWLLELLPAGGTGSTWPEWTETGRAAIRKRFLASEFGASLGLEPGLARRLTDELVGYGTDWSGGDPLRWSPVRVELVLADYVPRKVQLPRAEVADFPDLLRAFIRFAHAERDMAPDLTAETIEAVTTWEPDFREAIRRPPLTPAQNATRLARLAAGLDPAADDAEWGGADRGGGDGDWDDGDDGDGDGDDGDGDDGDGDDDLDVWETNLLEAIGGPVRRAAITGEPVPDEAFDWTGIPDAEHELVAATLGDVDRLCDALLDVEMRTLCRRYLAATVLADPMLFRRSQRTDLLAGGIVWAAARVQTGRWSGRVTGVPRPMLKDITGLLGGGAVSGRASSLEWKLRDLSRERGWWHSAFQRGVLDQFARIAELRGDHDR